MSKKGLALAVVVAAFVFLALAATSGDQIWREAYPHLPRRVQAAPYVLRAKFRAEATPIPLPTAAAIASPLTSPANTAQLGAIPTSINAMSDNSSDATRATGSRRPTPTQVVGSPSTAAESIPPAVDPFSDLPPRVALAAPPQQYQTWNNCGPATLAMALTALGASVSQSQAASTLKPDPDDKNVSPQELADYASRSGFDAQVRAGGSIDELKALLALGLPVIVETWFIPTPGDEMGHYLVLHGYDTVSPGAEGAEASPTDGWFTAADSYEGPGRSLPFAEFDDLWRVFNRTYVAVYPPERAPAVAQVWGAYAADDAMFERAEAVAREESAVRGDAFAWFNLGSSLAAQGDPEAASAFDRARALTLPWRMMWYQHGAFEAYAAAGRWDDVRALAAANLANAPNLEESHYWLGRAAEAAGDAAAARASYTEARRLNPNYGVASDALLRLSGS